MLVRVRGAIVMAMGMAVRPGLPAKARLDVSELPEGDGRSPGEEEEGDDEVAENAKIKPGDEAIDAAVQVEHADEYLEELDRADEKGYGDRQAGGGEIVKNFPQRIQERPVVGLRHQHTIGGIHEQHAGGKQ